MTDLTQARAEWDAIGHHPHLASSADTADWALDHAEPLMAEIEALRTALREQRRAAMIQFAAEVMEASPAEGPIPGLWNAPGYPELTTGQLVHLAMNKS